MELYQSDGQGSSANCTGSGNRELKKSYKMNNASVNKALAYLYRFVEAGEKGYAVVYGS
jgi:hypothetical protein